MYARTNEDAEENILEIYQMIYFRHNSAFTEPNAVYMCETCILNLDQRI